LFIALAIVVVIAQSPPQIPDDFMAQAVMIESRGNFKNKFDGIIYESYSTKRERIDVDHVHEHPVRVCVFSLNFLLFLFFLFPFYFFKNKKKKKF